jgi:hypothetical protein
MGFPFQSTFDRLAGIDMTSRGNRFDCQQIFQHVVMLPSGGEWCFEGLAARSLKRTAP